MMTKTPSRTKALCKQLALVPLLLCVIAVFSTKSIAQNPDSGDQTQVKETVRVTDIKFTTKSDNQKETTRFIEIIEGNRPVPCSKEGASKILLDEYEEISKKYETTKEKEKTVTSLHNITGSDYKRMVEIYTSMSKEQQSQQKFGFYYKTVLPKGTPPTAEVYESWKDSKTYGVWLDGKRIDNSKLNDYKYSDFSNFDVSRLASNAKNYGKHVFQVNLTTIEGREEYNKKASEDNRLYIYWRNLSINQKE